MTFAEHEAFKPWRCIRCGHKIKTAGDAASHRQLHLFGPNTCRKVFGGPRRKSGGGMRAVPRGCWR
jgi:hypothetical protein